MTDNFYGRNFPGSGPAHGGSQESAAAGQASGYPAPAPAQAQRPAPAAAPVGFAPASAQNSTAAPVARPAPQAASPSASPSAPPPVTASGMAQSSPPRKTHEAAESTLHAIGTVIEIAGSGSQVSLAADKVNTLLQHPDPAIANAGQVGSQIKIRVGNVWLLASIRTQRLDLTKANTILAQVDFLGEGDEERLTGKIYNFRRGVTRYPVPGSEVFAVSSTDLKQVYAADSRAHVEIGTVFPTRDIRGSLYEIGRAHV